MARTRGAPTKTWPGATSRADFELLADDELFADSELRRRMDDADAVCFAADGADDERGGERQRLMTRHRRLAGC